MVGEFGFSETRLPQVLLPVYPGGILPGVLKKGLVDGGVEAADLGIGLFQVD